MPEASALGPIDPNSLTDHENETEKSAPWIVRKLAQSMTGRIVVSSYESLKATGTSVVCLSPWGDSSPLLLPCIRFRDLAIHTVIAATGGFAAVAAPVMGPVADIVMTSFGDSILVEIGLHAGFEATTKVANDLLIEKPIKHSIPIHSSRLETTAIKVLLITLKFKITVDDAALGFYRSSIHSDNSLVSSIKDYLSTEKGWFSPYLFASARRPVIPRSMQPDVIFCHGPFLQGDYRIGETLLAESASVIDLSTPSPPPQPVKEEEHHGHSLSQLTDDIRGRMSKLKIPTLSNALARSRSPSPEPKLAAVPPPPVPRRMIIVLVGLKPHRKIWTSSQRPGESVINYILLNGAPAIVVPVKTGAPLLSWDTLTLEKLWEFELPPEGGASASGKFEGTVKVLGEYLDMCIDWDRFLVPKGNEMDIAPNQDTGRAALKDALQLLIAAAIRSKESKEVKKEVDADRAGVAMWRIP